MPPLAARRSAAVASETEAPSRVHPFLLSLDNGPGACPNLGGRLWHVRAEVAYQLDFIGHGRSFLRDRQQGWEVLRSRVGAGGARAPARLQ